MAENPKKKKLDSKVVWREARDLIWARRGRLAIGMLLMLLNRLSGFVLPISTKFVIDDVLGKGQLPPRIKVVLDSVLGSGPHNLLSILAAAAITATIIQAATSFALSQLLGIAAQHAITEMRRRVQQHVERLPVTFFDSTKSGILISRIMSDAEGVRNLIGTGLVQLVGGLVTAVIAMGVLFYLNWRLTLITSVTVAVFGTVMATAFRRVRPLFRKRGELNADVTGRLAESLGGIRVVKAYTAEKREDLIFTRGVHLLLRNVAQTMTWVSGVGAISTLLVGVVGVVMMLFGTHAILAHQMTLGGFVMYVYFTGLVAVPVMQIAAIGTQLSEAFAGLDRIRELMGERTEADIDKGREPIDDVVGDIEFRNVWFEYNAGVPVLKDVSFHAAPGTTTALVGSSGSGKSTLISLVMAFNRPLKGELIVDGRDLESIPMHAYRSHLGIVLQDNFLFDGSIIDNIRYSRPDATREEVLAVSRLAHVDEFVEPLEKGFDTIVGERGIKLSGGQRQRIAIARAILADPSILILDEATSSLDSESEALIQDGLRSLRSGRTTFVIAHRLSTIRSANQILVLEGGEIVERGSHRELLALGGRYRQLYDRQYHFEADRFVNPGEELGEDTTDEPQARRSRVPTLSNPE